MTCDRAVLKEHYVRHQCGAFFEGGKLQEPPINRAVSLMGLLPIMWSSGTGSDVMKRIAAPMVGGIITSFILELLIYPAIYTLWKWWSEVRNHQVEAPHADV